MERTGVRLQIPVSASRLKAIKVLAAQRDSSIAELVRTAIEAQYGDSLGDIERTYMSNVSTRKNKRTVR